MMSLINYIIWSPNPDIFTIGGLTIRWYGLLFATGFIISQQIMFHIYKKEGKPEQDVETLTIYMVIATIIGARLGHVLFYEPDVYLSDPFKIIKIWEGGLASHGAAIGILTAIYLYSNYHIHITFKKFEFRKQKREGQSFLWVVDRIVIVVALTGCLIRLGNFMNSEIVGKPTNSNYGVVFGWNAEEYIEDNPAILELSYEKPGKDSLSHPAGLAPIDLKLTFVEGNFDENNIRQFINTRIRNIFTNYEYISEFITVDEEQPIQMNLDQRSGNYLASIRVWGIPRHPAQLYESISSLLLFIFLYFLWTRTKQYTPLGRIFGIFLVVLFGLRFVYEFLKENQVAFEDQIPLNMGQWLSIPLVIAGIFILAYSQKNKIPRTGTTEGESGSKKL